MPTEQDHNDAVRLPAMLIGAISAGVCVLIALGGGYLSSQRGGAMSDGINTLIASIPGVIIASAVLGLMPARAAGLWAIPVLGMGVVRAFVSLALGMGIYALIGPDKAVFFLTLLVSLLAVLGIDVASVLSLISKHAPAEHAAGESEGVC